MVNKDIEKIVEFLLELYKQFSELPFGNSNFQNKNFVVNSQITKGRALRALCLRLRDRIWALLETYYSLRKENIEIEELKEKIKKEKNKYEKRKMELDLELKELRRIDTQKLVDDAIEEVNYLMFLYKKFPYITREEFELEEEEHFKKRLKKQLVGDGNLISLLDMGFMIDEKGNIIEAKDEFKYDVFENKELEDGDRK